MQDTFKQYRLHIIHQGMRIKVLTISEALKLYTVTRNYSTSRHYARHASSFLKFLTSWGYNDLWPITPKLAHWLLLPGNAINVDFFLCLFVLELGARPGQTDERRDRETGKKRDRYNNTIQ